MAKTLTLAPNFNWACVPQLSKIRQQYLHKSMTMTTSLAGSMGWVQPPNRK
jgi:hypothetical protein